MAKGPQTDNSGKIVKPDAAKAADPVKALQHLVEQMKPEMARALPRHVTPERMARIILTAVRQTPQLAQTDKASFLGCVMSLAQLGLEPNTPLGQAYLIPRKNRKRGTLECTLIIGYQGMLDMARRSGMVDDVYAYAVREGDVFKYSLGTDRKIVHELSEDPARETRPITHVYAVGVLNNGSKPFVVLTRAQVESRRARSAAAESGPWITDYEAMSLKTGVRALNPWIPKSAEMARAEALEVAVDQGKSVLTAADDAVTEILATHGLRDADAEVIEDGEKQPGAQEGGGEVAGAHGTAAGPAASNVVAATNTNPVAAPEAPALQTSTAVAEPEPEPLAIDNGNVGTLMRLADHAEKMLKRRFMLESPKGSKAWYLMDAKTLRIVNPNAERGVLVMKDGTGTLDRAMCADYVKAVKAVLLEEAKVEAQ